MANVKDNYLLNEQVANRLLVEKRRAEEEIERENLEYDEDELGDEGFDDRGGDSFWKEEIKKLSKMNSRAGAFREGARIGFYLRKKISEDRFDGGTFYAVLIMSLLKDILDVATLTFFGGLVWIVVTVALWIIFLMRRGNFIKRYLWKRFVFTVIVESILFLKFYPGYTILTIMLKLRMDKRIAKHKRGIEEINMELKNV